MKDNKIRPKSRKCHEARDKRSKLSLMTSLMDFIMIFSLQCLVFGLSFFLSCYCSYGKFCIEIYKIIPRISSTFKS